ncbi:MAG: MoaD/ThiS family protein [Candidatus Desulfofervidaceae bacterium]|nr:MoaD/ThiS family protein [Candidatus Desulfofervidaceae bacterium]
MIKVKFFPEGEKVEIEKKLTVKQLLKRLNLLPGTALVIRNKQLLTSDIVLKGGDEIEIRVVTSRG